MSPKHDIRTRRAVIAAGEQIPAQISELGRARARARFVALATKGAPAHQEDTAAPLQVELNPTWIRAFSWRKTAWAPAAVAAAVAAALLVFWRSTHQAGLPPAPSASEGVGPSVLTAERIDPQSRKAIQPGDVVTPTNVDSTHIRFSDGSDVALANGARVTMNTLQRQGAALTLESGTLAAAIVHQNSATAWDFHAGPFDVHVVGTAFDLTWEPATRLMHLAMREGMVRVEGCDVSPREVHAPNALDLGCASPTVSASLPILAIPVPSTSATLQSTVGSVALNPSAPGTASVVVGLFGDAGPASLEDLLAAGRFDEAYRQIASDFDERLARASAVEALRLGDIARLSSHTARAVQAYQGAERGSAIASLELAKLQLGAGDTQVAHASANRAEANGHGATREDARALAVEILLVAGRTTEARAGAAAYLEQSPNGRHAARMRQLLQTPAAPAASVGSAVGTAVVAPSGP